ncbi:MAG TPA: GGDEF domain-containing protein [Gammaproteobacteria bacterium]|nr:GGDEF domain-containing protein [Gammaproteobacteria bacterium]
MERRTLLTGYLGGLGAYVVCLLPPMLPIFQPALGPKTAGQLLLAAAVASALVALELLTEFDRRIGDPGARFTQAFLGIGVCAGLYAALAPVSQPQVVLMSLIWMALGLNFYSPGKVLVLAALYLTVYLNAYTRILLDTAAPLHGDALYVLLVSLTLCAFMYLRAHDYVHSHREKAELRDAHDRQAEELGEVKARIHALTMQDMDTIALKFPFFKEELKRTKQRADGDGVTFCVGLMEIDHFASLQQRYGDMVVKQLLREVVDRASKVLGKLGLTDAEDGSYHPIGRVGEGLYGIILPRSNLKGALACARQLHSAIELQSIRTMAGKADVTLTIGVVEYHAGESVDELMETVGRALERARLHHMEELQAAAKPAQDLPAVKAAKSASELRLLHHKEYDSPIH